MVLDVNADTSRAQRQEALFVPTEIGQFLAGVVDASANWPIHILLIIAFE